MNMELRGKDNLSRDSIDKISSHLAGLGAIHDLLSAQAGKNNELDEVDLGELIVKLVSNLPSNSSERTIIDCDEEIKIGTRVASTFAVVANELLMNSAKHGKGEIKILCSSMTKQGQTCSVNITNYSSSKLPADTFQKLQPGAGLKLIKFLSKADFKQEAAWVIEGSVVRTELIIPIL